MNMRLMSIASGSGGNCTYIGSDNTHILIDAGVSRKRICEGLQKADLSIKDIDAVFFTHEHSDHIAAAGVLARNDGIAYYTTKKTTEEILKKKSLGSIDKDLFNIINKNSDIVIGDLIINPFAVSHDAADPVAYTVRHTDDATKKIGVVTDLGEYNESQINMLKNCRILLAESNHDKKMLEVGPYPYETKQRIMSRYGHLSNDDCSDLINHLLHDNIKTLLLGHLSKNNNYELLAYETVRHGIDSGEHEYRANDFDIRVASSDKPSEIIEI